MDKNCFFDERTNTALQSGSKSVYIHDPSFILDDKIVNLDLNDLLNKHITKKKYAWW